MGIFTDGCVQTRLSRRKEGEGSGGGQGCLTQTWPCWWGGWPWGVEKRQGWGSVQRPDSVQVLRTMDSSGLALDAP